MALSRRTRRRGPAVAGLSREDIRAPALAPDAVFEILSPGDDRRDVADKVDVYLRAGTSLVAVVDPARRIAVVHDGDGCVALGTADVLRHRALPGFALPLGALFSSALDRPGDA